MTPSFPREHAPSLFYNIIGRYLKKQKLIQSKSCTGRRSPAETKNTLNVIHYYLQINTKYSKYICYIV